MNMSNINLDIKGDLMFFDNVKSNECEKLSKIYSNYVFFSDEGDIWKNGKKYTSKIKNISNKHNTVKTNSGEYKLKLNENKLSINLYSKYYWYIGNVNPFENNTTPSNNLVDTGSDLTGWRLLCDEEELKLKTSDFFKKSKINITEDISNININYIYNSTNTDIKNGLYLPFEDNCNLIKLDENYEYVYIAIPSIFVDLYSIGCYDIFMNNYFNDNNLISKVTIDYKNSYYIYRISYNLKYFLLSLINGITDNNDSIIDTYSYMYSYMCSYYSYLDTNMNYNINMHDNFSRIYYKNICTYNDVRNYDSVLSSNNYYGKNLYYNSTYLFYNPKDINNKYTLTLGAIEYNDNYKYVLSNNIDKSDKNDIIHDLYTIKDDRVSNQPIQFSYIGILSYYNFNDNFTSGYYNLSVDYLHNNDINNYKYNITNFDITIDNKYSYEDNISICSYDSETSITKDIKKYYNSDIIEISKPTIFFTINNYDKHIYPALEIDNKTEDVLEDFYFVKKLNKPEQVEDNIKFCIMFPHYNNYINYPFVINTNDTNENGYSHIGTNIRTIPLKGKSVNGDFEIELTKDINNKVLNYYDIYYDLLKDISENKNYEKPLTYNVKNYKYNLNTFIENNTNVDTIYNIYWCKFEKTENLSKKTEININKNNILKKYDYNIDFSICKTMYKGLYPDNYDDFSGIINDDKEIEIKDLVINLRLDDLELHKDYNQYLILCGKENNIYKIIKIYDTEYTPNETITPVPINYKFKFSKNSYYYTNYDLESNYTYIDYLKPERNDTYKIQICPNLVKYDDEDKNQSLHLLLPNYLGIHKINFDDDKSSYYEIENVTYYNIVKGKDTTSYVTSYTGYRIPNRIPNVNDNNDIIDGRTLNIYLNYDSTNNKPHNTDIKLDEEYSNPNNPNVIEYQYKFSKFLNTYYYTNYYLSNDLTENFTYNYFPEKDKNCNIDIIISGNNKNKDLHLLLSNNSYIDSLSYEYCEHTNDTYTYIKGNIEISEDNIAYYNIIDTVNSSITNYPFVQDFSYKDDYKGYIIKKSNFEQFNENISYKLNININIGSNSNNISEKFNIDSNINYCPDNKYRYQYKLVNHFIDEPTLRPENYESYYYTIYDTENNFTYFNPEIENNKILKLTIYTNSSPQKWPHLLLPNTSYIYSTYHHYKYNMGNDKDPKYDNITSNVYYYTISEGVTGSLRAYNNDYYTGYRIKNKRLGNVDYSYIITYINYTESAFNKIDNNTYEYRNPDINKDPLWKNPLGTLDINGTGGNPGDNNTGGDENLGSDGENLGGNQQVTPSQTLYPENTNPSLPDNNEQLP